MTTPERKSVSKKDCWDLSKLFADDAAWEKGLLLYKDKISSIEKFRGTLSESSASLKKCLDFMMDLGILEERLGYYSHLRLSEDGGDSANQDRFSRYMQAATQAEALSGYQKPEIQSIPDEKMRSFLAELPEYHRLLTKILRNKPHTLSEKEERLLALQEEANMTAQKAFAALTDVDFDFGTVSTQDGDKPLTQSSFQSFLNDPDREIREQAYTRFMTVYNSHKNTLAALYAGSVHLDTYTAQVRSFSSAREARLFPDNVPAAVYDNLIDTIHQGLPILHRYYALRKKVLGLSELRLFDTKLPLIKDIKVHHSYEEAVDTVLMALRPLGEDYGSVLREGLLGSWVDKYENKGKRSGAFSAGSYTGDPYILMNYKEDLLRDVFTLAHEAGHSMHSYYSVRNNAFQNYNYTIFEAEVASTFNEQLLMKYLKKTAAGDDLKMYLTGKHIDDIIATLFRQTMFAEFEQICHAMPPEGKPLTVESLRKTYRGLLEAYFGPSVKIEEIDEMEGLRIPHFYRSFYVYKYATGIAAAIALSDKVMKNPETERGPYLAFLRSGGSRFPLESLELAGVDMSLPVPIKKTVDVFQGLVEEMEAYFA